MMCVPVSVAASLGISSPLLSMSSSSCHSNSSISMYFTRHIISLGLLAARRWGWTRLPDEMFAKLWEVLFLAEVHFPCNFNDLTEAKYMPHCSQMRCDKTFLTLGQAKSYGMPLGNFFIALAGRTHLSSARLTKRDGYFACASSSEQHKPSLVCKRGIGDGKNLSLMREKYELLGSEQQDVSEHFTIYKKCRLSCMCLAHHSELSGDFCRIIFLGINIFCDCRKPSVTVLVQISAMTFPA